MIITNKLKNRISIFRKQKVETPIGDTFEEKFFKKVWADIIPVRVSDKNGNQILTNKANFKIIMRKTDILESDFIKYGEKIFEIDYIIENFDGKDYLEVFASISKKSFKN